MIALSREFKTIVFYGAGISQYPFIKSEFAAYPSVRVFQTNIIDELGQILSQSSLTAILLGNLKHVSELSDGNLLSLKAAGVRFYYLNDGPKLPREEMERLSMLKITTLTALSELELRTKLEMFILTKQRLSEKVQEKKDEDQGPKQSYFTHLKKLSGQWVIYVSTHEQEKEIEFLFGQSWTLYCMDLLAQAETYTARVEDPEFSAEYLSLIQPHEHEDKSQSLSVMHIKKDADFALTYQRALSFLAKI